MRQPNDLPSEEAPPIVKLKNFRARCESGKVPLWFAMEILIRDAATIDPALIVKHSHPPVSEALLNLAASLLANQTDSATESWRNVPDSETQLGLKRMKHYVLTRTTSKN
jgi:hypothetical protein